MVSSTGFPSAERKTYKPPIWAVPAAISVVLLFAFGPVNAQKAADRDIAAAVYDINRAGQQMGGLTPSRKSSIKRVMRGLKMAEQRLMQSKHQSDPSWLNAKAQLDQYRGQLNALLSGGQAAQAPAAATRRQAPASAGRSAAPKRSSVRQAAQAKPAPARRAVTMTSHHTLKLTKLKREVYASKAKLDKIVPKSLHNARERKRWHGRLKALHNNLSGFAKFGSHPEVANLAKVLPAMISQYQAVEKESLSTYAALGNIPALVQKMNAKYRGKVMPVPLDPPYTAERAKAWSQFIRQFASMANKDYVWLSKVRQTTNEHERLTGNALNGTLNHKANGAIRNAVSETRRRIKEPLMPLGNSGIKALAQMDASNVKQIRNRLLGEGDYARFMGIIRDARQSVASSQVINRSLGQKDGPEIATLTAQLNGYESKINALYERVLDGVRMPKAISNDTELLAIAAKVMSGPKHGHKWQRMLINGKKQSRKESTASYSGGVVTFYDYDWDEFQVATAEKTDGKTYIYYTKLKFFRSGSSVTPLNRWVVNRRFKSTMILPENVNK